MTETHTVGVTGAAGYIGSRVTKILLDAGHEVVPIDDFSTGDVEEIDGLPVESVDIRDRDALRTAFSDTDAIMHLAGISGVPDCEENKERAFDVNVGGTENVAWLCHEWGTPLVFPCSMAIIGDPVEFPISSDHPRNPLNFYGRSKALSEDDIHQLADGQFPAHVYVKSNLYGHHELGGREIGKNTVINIFVDKALSEEPLTVHEPGTQARDFIHVKDVARAYAHSLDELVGSDDGATTFTLASGDDRSIKDIAEVVQATVAEERGYEVPIEMVENPRESETDVSDFTVDTSEAETAIGFEAEYDVERAVREMIR
ncbi:MULTISPECIES: NAD(P)-dependent oxidoreductase [Halostella]|uniref:NAD-dependent epimerase/dehydratase family protein n=1 Tax=Halostella TaxID=1843185 RepID=UPI001081E84C|nr:MULTISPECIES: NAD-dependent epimerase/dehydratase family protein [Halostella]